MTFGLLLALTAAVATAPLPQTAKQLNDTGLAAVARGEYATGEKALSQALQIWRSLGPAFVPHAATEMMNLGDAICAQGGWGEGSKLFEQSLELHRRTMGPKHYRTLVNMNRLANVYVVQGNVDGAEALYREALAAEREAYPNDLQTAHSLSGLSSIHTRTHQWKDALAEGEEGLAITLRAVGENDAEAAMAYANVAQIHLGMSQTDRAIPLLRKAEAVFERTLGPANPRLFSARSEEGLALMLEHKYALAEPALANAVNLLSKSEGAEVQLSVAEFNLALLRIRQKRYSDADSLLSRALALEEEYSVRPGPDMAMTLNLLSQVREKENRPTDAAQLKSRAQTIASYR